MNPDLARARRAYLLVGVAAPLLLAVVATALALLWLPGMPEPAATHWSTGPEPDGFSPAWTYPAMIGGIDAGLVLLLLAITWAGARRGAWGWTFRAVGVLAPAAVAFLSIGLLGSMLGQLGLDDAHGARDAAWPLLIGLGVGIVAGVAAWSAQPSVTRAGEPAGRERPPSDVDFSTSVSPLRSGGRRSST